MDQRHSKRATIALQKLAELDPAFASLSLWCHHRDAQGVDAIVAEADDAAEDGVRLSRQKVDLAPAYTDGSTVYYGAKFEEWSRDEQKAVCAHELCHVAFRHVVRGKRLHARLGDAYNPRVFNIATDALINATLEFAGYKLPKPCVVLTELFDEVFGERVDPKTALSEYTAERLYFRIMDHAPKAPQSGKGTPQDGSGSGSESGDDSGDGEGGDQKGGQSKSGADAAEDYADSRGFKADMDDSQASGQSGPGEAQEDAEWQQRVARAMQSGKMAGRGIGQIGHMIADLPKSTTPWEVILRRLVTKAVTRTPQQSYARPTKRWLGMDSDARERRLVQPAYEPGVVNQSDRPRIAVGVDVSGSISDRILETFAAEIAAIGRKSGAEIHVIVFDTTVLSEKKLEGTDFESEVRKIEFARGGGTSFIEVVDRAAEIEPSIIVVLTDMHGPFGEAPGRIPVIWATPEETPPEAPFGRVLRINE